MFNISPIFQHSAQNGALIAEANGINNKAIEVASLRNISFQAGTQRFQRLDGMLPK